MLLALIEVCAGSFAIGLSGAMMPGPLLTATVGETARRGPATGPLVILGHGILEAGVVAAMLLGLGPFLERGEVFAVVALGGAAVLAWMALGMFRSLPALTLDLSGAGSDRGNRVATGVLLSAANPYWVLWWATVGLGLIAASKAIGPWGVAAFFVGHISADLAWYGLVTVAVWKSRRLLSDRAYRVLIGLCAVLLVGFAAWFAVSGVRRLIG